MTPRASVIVRARDEAAGIERALTSLRNQTVPVEILVVDSGSTDGTLEIARRMADRVIEIAPEDFTYGGALNIGAEAAAAPVHFALSAHCSADRADWVERSLAHYEQADVAATCGIAYAGRKRLAGPLLLRGVEPGGESAWGFSNHACSWRADVWREHRFDESLIYAEDREWSWRVMDAGWAIAFDPALWVDHAHQWHSAREAYRRRRLAAQALGPYPQFPEVTFGHLVRTWWRDVPIDDHSPLVHRFLNYKRLAGLVGHWVGGRAGRRP